MTPALTQKSAGALPRCTSLTIRFPHRVPAESLDQNTAGLSLLTAEHLFL